MGWIEDNTEFAEAHKRVTENHHEGEWSHELLAGAAVYEAMKQYEIHIERNGQPECNADARELLAGFAGDFIDHEVEAKGQDGIDREKAKQLANAQTRQELQMIQKH